MRDIREFYKVINGKQIFRLAYFLIHEQLVQIA